MSHDKRIDSFYRGQLIFLIDQSGSTSIQWGSKGKIQDEVARMVNAIIFELVKKGDTLEEKYKCRYDIACLGYGSNVESAFAGTLSHSDIVSSQEIFDSQMSEVVLSSSDMGGTNMKEAFDKAKQLIEDWIPIDNHMDCFPPMVFNITDGEYTGSDPEPVVDEIKQLSTHDGNVLVWNIHVSADDADREDMLLADDSSLSDSTAKKLFSMSSVLPKSKVNFMEYDGKRAFGYNLSPQSFFKLLSVGTLV